MAGGPARAQMSSPDWRRVRRLLQSAAMEPDDLRRKRLLFQARHRGFKEADLLLGGFAERELARMPAAELDAFERILEFPDRDIYGWIVEGATPPEGLAGLVLDRLRAFRLR